MRIAVCDDDGRQAKALEAAVGDWAEASSRNAEIRVFASAEAFLFDMNANDSYDVLLLDIEMPGMNGLELARGLRDKGAKSQIIFITGYPDYISQGYDVSALHYLLKPVKREKLYEVLDRVAEALKRMPKFALIPVGKEVIRVYFEDIIYAESQGHYLYIKTKRGEFRPRLTAGELAERLDGAFFKCGRSFLVGLRYVERITKDTVFLEDGTALPLGKGLYDEINKALINYLREA